MVIAGLTTAGATFAESSPAIATRIIGALGETEKAANLINQVAKLKKEKGMSAVNKLLKEYNLDQSEKRDRLKSFGSSL